MSSGPPAAQRSASMDETLVSMGASQPSSEELPLERGDEIGRYIILEEIGRGAMGMVLAAYDPVLDRRIALKLLPIYGRGSPRQGASARLQREAQAMARLAHPNVITVHDVGTAGEELFIAMEYIAGGSLRAWLAAERRPWQAVVRLFIDAGEGLAAAHRQGIVHRDFKPDNVLVRADGRACVGDFGLARRDEFEHAHEDEISRLRTSGSGSLPLDARAGLTMTGATMGTPAYMAPEQHAHDPVDARSDQFAFCVALWEALCGVRPFAGGNLAMLAHNVTRGQRKPWPSGLSVPARVRAAIERGLSVDPERRFEDMDELLRQLRRALAVARGRRRARWPLAVAALALGVAALAVLTRPAPPASAPASAPSPCSRAAEQLEGIWDASQRQAAEAAFTASTLPYAARSYARAAARLDEQRAAWIRSHTQACEATRVYGEQSEEMLDRRMICLAARRGELAAVSRALAEADEALVPKLDALLAALTPVSSCDDLRALEAGAAPPPPAQRVEVEQLRAALTQLSVDRRRIADGKLVERGAALVARAEQIAYSPALAEALNLHAQLLNNEAGPDPALPVARRAVAVASAANHREELADALTMVAWIVGAMRADIEQGMWLLELAEAESEHLGHPALLHVRIESDRASLLTVAGKFDEGLAHFERALELAEQGLGAEHTRAADLRFNIAATHHYLERHALAEQGFRAALEVYTALSGPDHPEVAQCHSNLASTLNAQGRGEEAERHAQRAREIWEASDSHIYLPSALGNLSKAARVQGQLQRALELSRETYALDREVFGDEHPTTLEALAFLAGLEHELGQLDAAERNLREAIERLSASVPDHPSLVEMRTRLSEVLAAQGREGQALAELDAIEAGFGEDTEEGVRDSVRALRAKIRAPQDPAPQP